MLELSDDLMLMGAQLQDVNCFSFARKVMLESCGIVLPNWYVPEDEAGRNAAVDMERDRFTRLDEPKVPCIITFKLHPKYVTHIGVYIGDGKFVHYTKKKGAAIERLHRFWKDKVEGYYEYKG